MANSRLEADIERERMLEQAQLDFFSAVSHELKTPITVIKGQLEGMIFNVGKYKERDKYLARSLEVVKAMEGMVQEILTVSRIKSSETSLQEETFDFSDMIKSEYGSFRLCASIPNSSERLSVQSHEKSRSDIFSDTLLISMTGFVTYLE